MPLSILHGNDCSDGADAWGFCKYNCTSWASWCVNKALGDRSLTGSHAFSNYSIKGKDGIVHNDVHLGNAKTWESVLQPFFGEDLMPAVGAIAWWSRGATGHVAYVNCISGSVVTLTEFNNVFPCYYSTRSVDVSKVTSTQNWIPEAYIHIENGGIGGGTAVKKLFNNLSNLAGDAVNISASNNTVTVEAGKISQGYISIYNIKGQKLLQQPLQLTQTAIDLQRFSKGIYFVAVKIGNTEIRKTEIR